MTRKTILDIQKMKAQGEKIVLLTAYDATSARVAEAAEIPVILVGDTLGMVIQGHSSTIPVTLDQMIYHCAIVARVTQTSLIVGDMPFMTASISAEDTLRQAARLMQEGGVTAVKLEGGEPVAPIIKRLTQAGIPVMAHIGLTPQSVNQFGGFKVQGRQLEDARQLVRDAEAVQAAGAFAVVLELVPAPLAGLITQRLSIPTIGIGAGPDCDGQVQVFHDILGLFDQFLPRHAKRYAEIGEAMRAAAVQYRQDVQAGVFPTAEQAFSMSEQVLRHLKEALDHANR
ncbi:MAG: 3-methyl-2-oxobutanoate hydroxymethyltransferase [Anaerolineae bacterium]|nr:3-methyl-2-oxobutanoate hydroxymethyltransferase [Anaerolineae bacterium]MDW8171372.1 3-methyl-2-oxobutanoate hydroxymethyltransferase [Anaerolineae bacterium]